MTEFRASLLRGVLFHAASVFVIMTVPLLTDWVGDRELQVDLWKPIVIFGLLMVFLLGVLRRREVEESFTVVITESDVSGWDAGTPLKPGRTRISIPLSEIDWTKTLVRGWTPPVIASYSGSRINVERAHFSGKRRALIRKALEAAALGGVEGLKG
jgi:hypothetical protein